MASPILAGLVILMIGDSHFTYPNTLVTTLQDLLVSQGASVTSHGACGARASVWAYSGAATCGLATRSQFGPIKVDQSPSARVPTVTQLANEVHPNLIIISLGDTMAYYPAASMPVDAVRADITALTSKLAALNTPCIWVGPGWGSEGGPAFKTFARTQQMDELLAQSVAPCQFINTIALARPGEWPTYDGMHYTVPGYQKWAFAIDAAVLKLVPHSGS
jgi:hypothetical protein